MHTWPTMDVSRDVKQVHTTFPAANSEFPGFALRRATDLQMDRIECAHVLLPLDKAPDQLVNRHGAVARKLFSGV